MKDVDRRDDIEPALWRDWRWQLQNALRTPEELCRAADEALAVHLDEAILRKACELFPLRITPHVLRNMADAYEEDDEDGLRALLATFVPTAQELDAPTEVLDGIGEERDEAHPAPLVTNFYHDRVLLFACSACASYCRYCFRRRKVAGGRGPGDTVGRNELEQALSYIEQDTGIREVIISGGDPFMMSDDRLVELLGELYSIDHVNVLRLDTKILTALPQRITPELVQVLSEFKPLYIVGSFLHAVELTPDTLAASSSLVDAGIPVVAHTALLHGINDDPEIIAELMWELFKNRILPYYLIQFIPTKWTEHFRVPIARGLEIMDALHGRVSGLANPTYIVYLPDGKGKVPIQPNYVVRHDSEGYLLRNFERDEVLYREPPHSLTGTQT